MNKKPSLLGSVFLGSVNEMKSKFLESFDQYKDFGYLLYFKHSIVYLCILIGSITVPFAVFYATNIGISAFSLPQCLLVYFHLTSNSLERQAKENGLFGIAL